MCLTFANYVTVLQVKMAYIDRKLALQQSDLFLNVTGFLRQTDISQKVGPGGRNLHYRSHSGTTIIINIIYTLIIIRGFAKLKKFKKSKKKLEVGGWVQAHSDKKNLENRPKIKFCVCTILPCLAVHVVPHGVHACSILSHIL